MQSPWSQFFLVALNNSMNLTCYSLRSSQAGHGDRWAESINCIVFTKLT
jgi:hypothetical protein